MTIQRVSFQDHLASLDWKQSEHVLIVGPNGSGKTTLAGALLKKRQEADGFIVMPITKSEDATLRTGDFRNYKVVNDYNPAMGVPYKGERNVMIWPKLKRGMDASLFLAEQRRVFRALFNDLLHRGRRTVVIDEMHMMSDPHFIGMAKEIALQFHQGRSHYVTMVALSQRPSWIPVIVYPSVVHAYIARTANNDDLKRLSELGGVDAKLVADTVRSLPDRHDFLYLNPMGDAPLQIVNTNQ